MSVQYGLMCIYFILWLTFPKYRIYFLVQIIPALAFGNSFRLAPMSVWCALILCFSVLCWLSSTTGHLLSFHIFPAPAFESDISAKSSDFLSWRVVFRNESQGFGHAPCYQPCPYWLALASVYASVSISS